MATNYYFVPLLGPNNSGFATYEYQFILWAQKEHNRLLSIYLIISIGFLVCMLPLLMTPKTLFGVHSLLANMAGVVNRGAEYAGYWDTGSQALFLPGTFCEKMNSAWKGVEVKDTFCQKLLWKDKKCLEKCRRKGHFFANDNWLIQYYLSLEAKSLCQRQPLVFL